MGVPSLFKEAHLLYDSLQSAASTDERKTTAAGHHTLSVNRLQADVQNCRCEPGGGTHYATSACSPPSVRTHCQSKMTCAATVLKWPAGGLTKTALFAFRRSGACRPTDSGWWATVLGLQAPDRTGPGLSPD
uniref:Survival factor 1 n=1 Tax=Lygus hesperus TaxID=30085 RepID=A0A0A9WBR0_LYGHE